MEQLILIDNFEGLIFELQFRIQLEYYGHNIIFSYVPGILKKGIIFYISCFKRDTLNTVLLTEFVNNYIDKANLVCILDN